MPDILCRRRREYIKVSCAEDECVENLGDERDAYARKLPPRLRNRADSPSALLFEWMAHISMSFDDVCDTSPRMWKRLNFMFRGCYGSTARGQPPVPARKSDDDGGPDTDGWVHRIWPDLVGLFGCVNGIGSLSLVTA